MTNAILRGEPDAGNSHVWFDEGEGAFAKPRRGSLRYNLNKNGFGSGVVCVALLTSLISVSLPSSAKTTTWTGGATYKPDKIAKSFTDPDNWDNGAPEPGDTVVISCSTAWDNPVYIGKENGTTDQVETFDFGDKGLTFDISSSFTRLLVDFKGSGKIVKVGTGCLGFACDTSHTGGTEIRKGGVESWKYNLKLGTGVVEMNNASGTKPTFNTSTWNCGMTNAVSITGDDSGYTILNSGQLYPFYGAITSTHDVTFAGTYGGITFYSTVSAPGKTITVNGDRTKDEKSPPNISFEKAVDASLIKQGNRILYLRGVSTNPDNRLTIEGGSCTISDTGRWAGTNIVLKSTAVQLSLNGASNLAGDAVISIENNAKISIAAGVTAQIRGLTVGGVAQPAGVYSQANLPDVISGSGVLQVGMGKRTTWIGPCSGNLYEKAKAVVQSFTNPANWDNGVPTAGDTLVFTNVYSWYRSVSFGLPGETLDIGSKGILIESTANVQWGVPLTGAGSVTVTGSGSFDVFSDSDHTGGTFILGGRFESLLRAARFGTQPVELCASGSVQPIIESAGWAYGVTNKVIFRGSASYKVMELGQSFTFWNDVVSEHDFEMVAKLGPFTFVQNVSAPGKTWTVKGTRDASDNLPHFYCKGSVDANIVKNGNRSLYLQGVSTNADSSLTIRQGSCVIEQKGSWAGTNVVVEATAAGLELKTSASLSAAAVVRLATTGGAKIGVAKGVKVRIAELWVDGVRLPDGTYSAQSLPGALSGLGRLKVGNSGLSVIVR